MARGSVSSIVGDGPIMRGVAPTHLVRIPDWKGNMTEVLVVCRNPGACGKPHVRYESVRAVIQRNLIRATGSSDLLEKHVASKLSNGTKELDAEDLYQYTPSGEIGICKNLYPVYLDALAFQTPSIGGGIDLSGFFPTGRANDWGAYGGKGTEHEEAAVRYILYALAWMVGATLLPVGGDEPVEILAEDMLDEMDQQRDDYWSVIDDQYQRLEERKAADLGALLRECAETGSSSWREVSRSIRRLHDAYHQERASMLNSLHIPVYPIPGDSLEAIQGLGYRNAIRLIDPRLNRLKQGDEKVMAYHIGSIRSAIRGNEPPCDWVPAKNYYVPLINEDA